MTASAPSHASTQGTRPLARVAETDRADSCGDGLRNLLIDPVVVEMSRRWHALMTAAAGNDAARTQRSLYCAT